MMHGLHALSMAYLERVGDVDPSGCGGEVYGAGDRGDDAGASVSEVGLALRSRGALVIPWL